MLLETSYSGLSKIVLFHEVLDNIRLKGELSKSNSGELNGSFEEVVGENFDFL
jgi:hypothetical protein